MAHRRAGRRYQQFKAQVRLAHAEAGWPCWLCRKPIDYLLSYPHPASWSLDHRTALHLGGDEFDPANAMPSHLRCNLSRGGKQGNAIRRARTNRQRGTSATW